MKFFSIRPSNKNEFGYVTVNNKWGLPGVECNDCKETWANTGINYPTINLEELDERHLFEKPKVVDVLTYRKLVGIIKTHFPQLEMLTPGTRFGNLVGKLDGKPFNNFVPSFPTDILIEEILLKSLSETKLNLPNWVQVNLVNKNNTRKIYEFELLPKGKLLNPIITNQVCKTCEHESVIKPNSLIVDKESVPRNLDIFRLSNFSTIMVASERFVEKIKELKIESVEFGRIRCE